MSNLIIQFKQTTIHTTISLNYNTWKTKQKIEKRQAATSRGKASTLVKDLLELIDRCPGPRL
jgi:hypothetical protein